MLFKKREWFARLDGFHPQTHLAQFHGHRIDVYAVDTATNNITQGFAPRFGRWFLFACANGCQSFGNTVRCSNQEVAAATGGIADLEVENSSLRVWPGAGFIQDGI